MKLHVHMSIVIILYRCLPVLTERLKMDRRRLEQAHFRFAIIQVSTWYTDLTLDGVVFNEEAVALTEFTTKYQKKLHSFYSGKFTNVTMHINTHNL